MNNEPNGPQQPWDRLSVAELSGLEIDDDSSLSANTPSTEAGTSALARMAAGWADLVVVGIVTTGILAGVLSAGYSVRVAALPWAAGIAVLWWVLCSVLCVRIRRGTPGMLIAGVVFSDEIAGLRIAWTVLAAAVVALFLGLPALPGGKDRTLFSVASGSPLVPA